MANTFDSDDDSTNPASHPAIHVWANPSSTAFPLRRSPARLSVGTPTGPSTNSWKVWIRGEDAYVACRDNFREIKVSLHASGIWRLGFTEQFTHSNRDMVPPEKDRAWKKWRATLDDEHRMVIAFQIVCPLASLYLSPKDRAKWPTSIVFVEPAPTEAEMTVLSVCVVLGQDALAFNPQTRGAVIAVLPLGSDRTLQVVVTHENMGDIPKLFSESFGKMLGQFRPDRQLPDEGVFFLLGNRGVDIPWVGAVPFRQMRSR
jgi:hypothetical protein